MNTSQLAALRWMMERELSALRSPRMSPEISLKCPDENELASRLSERAVDERLTARRVERIRDLENALRRIEVMDYGVCEACGEPIPLLRLLASPSVRYCVACQQELEEEERAVVVTGSFDAPRPRRTMPPRPVTPPMPFFLPRRRQASHLFEQDQWLFLKKSGRRAWTAASLGAVGYAHPPWARKGERQVAITPCA